MAAKKKVQRAEETTETKTETKPATNKPVIKDGVLVMQGEVDVVHSTETNGISQTTAEVKDGSVVLSGVEDPKPTPKKRGRPRKVRLEDGVITMTAPDEKDKED